MSHPITKLFSVVLLAGFVFAIAKTANAFEITQGIVATGQTACVDVAGSKTDAGSPIDAFPCNGGFNEQWGDAAGNLEGLGTSANGANCASPDTAGDLLVLDSCLQTGNWSFWENGWVQVPFGSGSVCLDSQGQYGAGAQIATNNCNASSSTQSWTTQDIVFTQPIPTGGTACVDVQQENTKNNTAALAYPCTFGPNERWTYVGGQLRGIGTSLSRSTCLGEQQKKVVLQTCVANDPKQQWFIFGNNSFNGQNGVIILNDGVNGCLDTKGNYGPGQQLVLSSLLKACNTSTVLWTMR